jgi:hypothetical protein
MVADKSEGWRPRSTRSLGVLFIVAFAWFIVTFVPFSRSIRFVVMRVSGGRENPPAGALAAGCY